MVSWSVKEFDDWISAGCPKNDTVTSLDLNNCKLTSLPRIYW